MHTAYFETVFNVHGFSGPWPTEFAIITAYASTGETRSLDENENANLKLAAELSLLSIWKQRVTGFSPTTGHAEPGWALELPFEIACDLGLKYRQDAIYYVTKGSLFVSYCDQRRETIPVAVFWERITALTPKS